MKKTKIIIVIILTLLLPIFTFNVIAGNEPAENSKGLCDAWFSKDGINWENTTARTSLKLGEPFYIKVLIRAKMDLNFMSYTMTCYGPPYDFERVEDPTNLPENAELKEVVNNTGRYIADISYKKPVKDQESIIIWKFRVKPDSEFGGGNTPINLDGFFTKGGTDSVLFTAVSVSIINELWEGYIEEPNDGGQDTSGTSEGGNTPGFELIVLVLAVGIVLFLKQRYDS